MVKDEKREQALQVIAAVNTALKNGMKHYDKDGKLLKTSKSILKVFSEDGSIKVDSSKWKAKTTFKKELKLVRKEYEGINGGKNGKDKGGLLKYTNLGLR